MEGILSLPGITIWKSEINCYVQVDFAATKYILEKVYGLSYIKLHNIDNVALEIKQFCARLEVP